MNPIMIKNIRLTVIMAAALTFAACGEKTQNAAVEADSAEVELHEIVLTAQQMKTVDIETGKMENRQLGQIIRASGQLSLDPQSRAEVSSLVGGVVRSINVREGNRVSAGQTVAYIENTDIVELQRSYLAAVSEQTAAAQELDRQRLLDGQGAGVKKTLQQAETAFSVAKSRVSGISQQLRQLGISPKYAASGRIVTRIPIKSPISGIVGKIQASIGSYADMQTVLMTVVDNSKLHCDLRVFEKDIPYLKTGQTVDLMLTNDRNVRMQGRVYDINSAFDDDTKAIKVHVSLPAKPSYHLMPDMFVTGLINVGTHTVTAMPDESIISRDGKKYIFMQTGKTKEGTQFVPVEVVTGVSELGYTQVTTTTEVSPDALFVKKNAFYISSMLDGGEDEH